MGMKESVGKEIRNIKKKKKKKKKNKKQKQKQIRK